MPSLNIDLNYRGHPKITRLVSLCGSMAEGMPIWLWIHTGRYHPESGYLFGYSPQEIEGICGWRGEPGKLVASMVKVGLIEEIEGGYQIHDWQEHAGHIVKYKQRASAAAKARYSKSGDLAKTPATSSATSMLECESSSAKGMLSNCIALKKNSIQIPESNSGTLELNSSKQENSENALYPQVQAPVRHVPGYSDEVAVVASEFHWYQRGIKERVEEISGTFQGAIEDPENPITLKSIQDAVKTSRDRSERSWDLCKRLKRSTRSQGPRNGIPEKTASDELAKMTAATKRLHDRMRAGSPK